MKASKTTLTSLVAGGAALLFGTSLANAGFVLTLDDLSTAGVDVIVVDNVDGGVGTGTAKGPSNAADSNLLAGVVFFSGAVGSFIVNVTTGISDPVIGPSRLDLNSVNVSGAAGTLEIMLTDTGYTMPVGNLVSAIGGTTDGTVEAWQSLDPSNAEFGMPGATSVHHGPFAAGAFSDTLAVAFPLTAAPYSITEQVTITHAGAGDISSFDFESTAPEPASLGMLGLGLVGLGFAARRRRKTA